MLDATKNDVERKYRGTAVIVGLMFITATVTAIASMLNLGSILEEQDLLGSIGSNETTIVISVILELILAVCVMGIGFLMYPILKKRSEGIAMGYVIFRTVESMLIIIASVSLIALITLGNDFTSNGWYEESFKGTASMLLSLREWSFVIGTLIFLGLGGLLLNYGLFRMKIVPGWLSGAGFFGAGFVVIYGIISLFGYDPAFLAIVIGIQEMVFAVWIIVRGFDTRGSGRKPRLFKGPYMNGPICL